MLQNMPKQSGLESAMGLTEELREDGRLMAYIATLHHEDMKQFSKRM